MGDSGEHPSPHRRHPPLPLLPRRRLRHSPAKLGVGPTKVAARSCYDSRAHASLAILEARAHRCRGASPQLHHPLPRIRRLQVQIRGSLSPCSRPSSSRAPLSSSAPAMLLVTVVRFHGQILRPLPWIR
ncbi:hypothetical protein BRADI_3g57917v3 [Brachypodium distachyon]|uniref:Uncharacterized protein n=1 Tax=Brachypodium distachyon TaxID=15368 RepID=A0A2K2D5L0_BRADI|nr:hypothetical protein BRADI_3g57917v3 [Brachypodium distachyon]